MLDINVRDIRQLTFEMEISGISPDQLEGRLRFFIDNIEYGIPAKITNSEIQVEIPPLRRLVQRELKEGEKFEARLDVFGDSHYLKPWHGEFRIKNPVLVEAKIKEDSESGDPKIKVKVSEGGGNKAKQKLSEMKQVTKQKKIIKEKRFKDVDDFKKKLKKEDVIKWLNKNGTKNPEIQDLVYEQTASEIGSTTPYKILISLQKIYKKI